MAAHAACGRSPLSVCPRWCWIQTSDGGGRVLLTWSCSYGNAAGSAGLCIRPVCQFDSEDWFPVITRTHSSLLPSEIILRYFRNNAVVVTLYRYVFVFVFFPLGLNNKGQGRQILPILTSSLVRMRRTSSGWTTCRVDINYMYLFYM